MKFEGALSDKWDRSKVKYGRALHVLLIRIFVYIIQVDFQQPIELHSFYEQNGMVPEQLILAQLLRSRAIAELP